MSSTSIGFGENAKKAGREPACLTTQVVRLVDRVLKVSQSIVEWRKSPQKELARTADVSPRSIEYWGNGRGLSADALANLIRSEEGFRFLNAVMEGAQPKWWRVCAPLMEFAEVQEMQLRARKKLRRVMQGAVDADADLTAALARTEAALSVQDADFHQPQIDAQRAMARVHHRAVDTPKGRR